MKTGIQDKKIICKVEIWIYIKWFLIILSILCIVNKYFKKKLQVQMDVMNYISKFKLPNTYF